MDDQKLPIDAPPPTPAERAARKDKPILIDPLHAREFRRAEEGHPRILDATRLTQEIGELPLSVREAIEDHYR